MTVCGFSLRWKPFWHDLAEFFFPHVCAWCGCRLEEASAVLCGMCMMELNTMLVPHSLPFPGTLYERSFAGFQHEGLVRTLIHRLKYEDRQDIGVFLGALLPGRMDPTFPRDVDVVTPVPLHPVRMRERGYNQAEIVARAVATVLDRPCAPNLLTRTRPTRSQTRMSRSERIANVKDGFSCDPVQNVSGKHVLLVDDVMTTGSTLKAGAEALKAGGADRIFVLTIARA